MRKILATTCVIIIAAASTPAWSWGFKGHQIVGAIADQIIARDHPELREQLNDILDGKGLSEVAVYADCALFSCSLVSPGFFDSFKMRNLASDKYHYTDVPVQRRRYVAGSGGTHPNDVVQVLRYAAGRLRGLPPTDVPANLDQAEAVWMIAHLVGDIHQPLHVGAIYFDNKCAAVIDPGRKQFSIGTEVAETHGGGWLRIPPDRQLHKLWDNEAVEAAMKLAGVTDESVDKFAAAVLANPPTGWETQGDVSSWSRRWANEILPLAKEAHDRIAKIHLPGVDQDGSDHRIECRWQIDLSPGYDEWAAERVREQLAKAGFRLAAMLRVLLEDN